MLCPLCKVAEMSKKEYKQIKLRVHRCPSGHYQCHEPIVYDPKGEKEGTRLHKNPNPEWRKFSITHKK